MALTVSFFGTRGSIPTPGPGTTTYGGNTPSLLVESDGGARVVIDAGTGARHLGRRLDTTGKPLDVAVLLSHTHWDHIQGLPFFAPLYRAGNRVRIVGPRQPSGSLAAVLESQMTRAVFPVPLEALSAELSIAEVEGNAIEVSGFEITTTEICHPGATIGFSLRDARGGPSVSYLTDNELGAATPAQRAGFVRFLHGSSVLIHDAMYFTDELVGRRGWGHSSAAQAVELAAEAGLARLVLFHHDPDHDDRALERLGAEAEAAAVRIGAALDVTIAAEGRSICS